MAKKRKAIESEPVEDLVLSTASTTGEQVQHRQDSADPNNLLQRYFYNPESGQVQLRGSETTPAFAQMMKFEPQENGGFSAKIPQLATASFAPSSMQSAPGFSGMDVENFALWEAVDSNCEGKIDIRRAMWYYKVDAVAFRCVNLLAELSNSRITHSSSNPQALELIDNWRKKAMPHTFLQNFFVEYFKVGWVMPFKTLVKYKPKEFRSDRIPAKDAGGNIITQSFASEDAVSQKTQEVLERMQTLEDSYSAATAAYEQAKAMHDQKLCSEARLVKLHKAMANAQYEWQGGQIPGAYTLLDPLAVYIEGPREMNFLRQPFLMVDGQVVAILNNPSPWDEDVVNSIPTDIREQIKNGRLKVWLSPNICPMIYGDKPPYERYPTPIMRRAFQFLMNKQELIEMDRSTARTVKNRILLVKIGSDEFPVFDPNQINKVQTLFNTPGRNLTFFWNHCITMEWIEPNLNGLMDEKKYDTCDNQTRMAYGITKRLMGANDKSSSTSVLDFEGVKQIVEEGQAKFLEFYQREVDMVRAALGISAEVTAQFDKLDLQDEMKFWGVLTQAVMNGLIDQQTALETLHFHFPTIVSRMKEMKKLKSQGLFMPMPSANNLGPDGSQNPSKGSAPTKGNNPKKGGTPASGTRGGKPANSPNADNNANRAGKIARPTKAKAKIQTVGDHIAVVVDLPHLDGEQVQDLVNGLTDIGVAGVTAEWVMTRATFEKNHGPIMMFTPYPDLSPAEAVACYRETSKLSLKVEEAIEVAAASYKKESGGPRGAYVTEKKREEIATASFTKVLAEYLPQVTGEDQMILNTHLENTIAALKEGDPEIVEADAKLAATVIVKKRFEKAKTQAAVPNDEDLGLMAA